jgi:iron-sulfur cluster repair protein YtfE (RIC family)
MVPVLAVEPRQKRLSGKKEYTMTIRHFENDTVTHLSQNQPAATAVLRQYKIAPNSGLRIGQAAAAAGVVMDELMAQVEAAGRRSTRKLVTAPIEEFEELEVYA